MFILKLGEEKVDKKKKFKIFIYNRRKERRRKE